ncbi:MAG: RecX family transcriptional regulator [Rhodospirillales bacterium]|nr:RecX family transcriptional regulator [Rhodospirillales bacterium]
MDRPDKAHSAKKRIEPRKRVGPKPVTKDRLGNIALFYLERYASSAANLRRVLLRRVDRSARLHGTDAAEGALWVDELVQRYIRSGLVNDKVYAEAVTSSLRRRGASTRMVKQKLAMKGVDADTVDGALDATGGADEASDLKAAFAYARRRRLGPFGPAAQRQDRRQRDMAALGRAGFGYGTARKVVDWKGDEEEGEPD